MRFFDPGFLEPEELVLMTASVSSFTIAMVSFLSETLNFTFLAMPVIVVIAARYFFLRESRNLNYLYSVIAIFMVTTAVILIHYI